MRSKGVTFGITAVRGGDVGCKKQDCRGLRCMPLFVAPFASPGQGIQFSRTQVFSPEGGISLPVA